MPDRKKVIAWLADEELYYREHGDTHNSLMACDALALLKEQEAIWNDVLNVWTCPSCGQMVSTNYCRDCGQAVKWE